MKRVHRSGVALLTGLDLSGGHRNWEKVLSEWGMGRWGDCPPQPIWGGTATGIWRMETREAAKRAAVPRVTQFPPTKNYPALRELRPRTNPG